MKKAAPILCAAILFVFLSAHGATTPTPTLSSFAGNYKPTVSTISLADDSDAFVGGSYTNFKIKIARNGRGTGKALFHSPDGLTVVPVKIKVRVSKLKVSGGKATADVLCVGNDELVGFGSVDLTPPSRKRTIFFTFVKGDFHSFALFIAK